MPNLFILSLKCISQNWPSCIIISFWSFSSLKHPCCILCIQSNSLSGNVSFSNRFFASKNLRKLQSGSSVNSNEQIAVANSIKYSQFDMLQNYFGLRVFFNRFILPIYSFIGLLLLMKAIFPVAKYISRYNNDIISSLLERVYSLNAFLLLKAKLPWNSFASRAICSYTPS